MKKIIALLIAVGALSAQASLTYTFDLYQFQDNSGNGLDGVIMAFIDTNGDLWGDTANHDGSAWAVDPADVLVNSLDTANGYYASGSFQFNLGSGVDTGDNIYIAWYDGVKIADSAPGVDTYFGVYDSGYDVANDGDTITTTPNYSLTETASFQTIPEPATALLALIGGGLAYAVRRRGHKFVS